MIYEYFLGKFASAEGKNGGEFFTPTCLVKLIVNIIEPFNGRIYDPTCGSGGMFVQSAEFIKNNHKSISDVSIFGQEKKRETVKIAKMNLALHGLTGQIKEGNTLSNDLHDSYGKFDYVMANPPFSLKKINFEKLKGDKRFNYTIPETGKGKYLWIQIFNSALNDKGRAGFVMANSASDSNTNADKKIRKQMIEDNLVDVMVSVGSNMFHNVTLPCTLWFLDKDKSNTPRKDKVLFLDVRNIYRQIDRAHREFTPEQIQFIANIVRLYRGEDIQDFQDYIDGQIKDIKSKIDNLGTTKTEEKEKEKQSLKQRIKLAKDIKSKWADNFADGYQDIKGLCKMASKEKIANQNYSLNSGRYVGVKKVEQDFDFDEKITELNSELKELTSNAHKLEDQIFENVDLLLDK